jgi:hypothetical protein
VYSKFRRQFILGKKIVMKDWKQSTVNNKYFLSTHKDLEVNQIKEDGKELTLIGYIINPHEPNHTNLDCLKSIYDKVNTIHDIFDELYIYGGRFILIGAIKGEMILATDPCGLRQVYYTNVEGEIWFASQPNLLINHFNIPKRSDKEVEDFISSSKYEDYQRCWIGNDCIYENVYHLMPNHFYDLNTREAKRYWINKDKGISYLEAVNKGAVILEGSMRAIAKRGNLIQGLTAGWDSRMLLAASKDTKDTIQYYVSLGDDKFNKGTDFRIATKLSEELKLNLHVMDRLDDVRDEVAENIRQDVTQGRKMKKTRTIQYFYDRFQNYINVNGNISEIVRNRYGTIHPETMSVEYLIKLNHYEGIPFVKNNLKEWMKNIPNAVLEDISLPDLMYWEQKMGNWAAMQKAEQDIALEDFAPFNNRELLMTLYSVDNKYREPGSYILYKDILRKMWPETLAQPINPEGMFEYFSKIAKRILTDEQKRKIKKLIG